MRSVCVFCGGNPGRNPAYNEAARSLGAAFVKGHRATAPPDWLVLTRESAGREAVSTSGAVVERKQLRDLVGLVTKFTATSPVTDAQRVQILTELYEWITGWSTTAHAVIKRRQHLIADGDALCPIETNDSARLHGKGQHHLIARGLAVPRKSKKEKEKAAEENEGEEEGGRGGRRNGERGRWSGERGGQHGAAARQADGELAEAGIGLIDVGGVVYHVFDRTARSE